MTDPGWGSVGVSVPATTANLGPGYDSFGAALDVALVAVAGPREDRRVIAVGDGETELPTGEDNLVWQSLRTWCDHVGAVVPEVSVRVSSAIPLQRGMGSSSAAAVAGLMLGRALTGGGGGIGEVLALATDLEGHPDNAAAALHGGLVVCTADGHVTRVTPGDSLRPVMIIPVQRQSTTEARAVLPAQVTLADAARNAAAAAATFAGLAGIVPLRASTMVDRLHEPARLGLMPTSRAAITALRDADVPAVLSGAGPSVLALVPSHDHAAVDRLHDLVHAVLDPSSIRIQPTRWDLAGAQACPPNRETTTST